MGCSGLKPTWPWNWPMYGLFTSFGLHTLASSVAKAPPLVFRPLPMVVGK